MYEHETRPSLVWMARHFSRNRYIFRPGQLFRFAGLPNVMHVRFEHLQEDLNNLLDGFGLPQVEVPHIGRSEKREGKHYSEMYDSETRLLVEWAFGPEIRSMGYRFEEDPPWHDVDGLVFDFPNRSLEELMHNTKTHGPLKVGFDAVIEESGDE